MLSFTHTLLVRVHARRWRLGLIAAVVSALVCGVAGASAQAASLVYVQGGNVYIANADGSSPHQVTTDGSTSNPQANAYRSPTEADDGTIVAAKGGQLVRMSENGTVLSQFEPATRAYPLAAAVSPNGRRVAYNYSEITQCTTYDYYNCGYYPSPGAAIENADGSGSTVLTNSAQPLLDGEWIDSSTLVLATNSSYVDYDVDGQGAQNWFVPGDSFDPFGSGTFPYVEQPDVSRGGHYLAVVLRPNGSGGNPSAQDVLEIWQVNGAPPAAPTPLCGLQAQDSGGFQRPGFAPDNSALIWTDAAGVESLPIDASFVSACQGSQVLTLNGGTPLAAGASDGSFGEAANAPAPRPAPAPGPAPSPGPGSTHTVALSVALPGVARSVGRTTLMRHGLKFKLRCNSACSYNVTLAAGASVARKLGLRAKKGTAQLGVVKGSQRAAGTRSVTIKLSRAAQHGLSRIHRGSLALSLTLKATSGKSKAQHSYKLTVKS
jgi:hypothetical protein